MAVTGKQGGNGGQRGNLSSTSGQKKRSETSSSHSGSRQDPSHAVEKSRSDRAKKTATQGKKAGK